MRGMPFPEQYYYHRGMAISIVTSRLVHPVEAISDPTIGAVALLSNSDVSKISTDPNIRNRFANKRVHTLCSSRDEFADPNVIVELHRCASRSSTFPH
jgi:hypothetical protein